MKIGIDLGTTNSALAYIDPDEAGDLDFPPIHIFEIPQMVAPGRVEPRRVLPSFLFLEDGQPVGEYAREQGALVPTRLVHSAKSWLSNAEVDRTARILPWDSQQRVLSPVEVSARFLRKFREEWDRAQPDRPLSGLPVVLTVPASFDEEARELTVQAAQDAGLTLQTLLEEPAAAFYAWIANNLARSRKALHDGQLVLVCDVGGGTSDFSLIRVSRQDDRVDFTRTAVGRHLLLGGDNLDLTLAWLAETKLGKPLSLRQRNGLRRQCAAAKERLLCDPNLPAVEITVLGTGTSLIGGALKTSVRREEALELALEGFLPFTERGERPKEEKRSLFRELGLPYVSDPAITRHLGAFLEDSGQPGPDAILFNGGFFIPEVCRQRVADVVERWYGKRPEVFENRDLDLAVAAGAAYYAYARTTGSGVLVRGGLPRAYYLGIGEPEPDKLTTVCLVPRGTEEGVTLGLEREGLQLVANRPVAFRLYSSLTRVEDRLGEVVEFSPGDDSLHTHAPLHAVIRFGKRAEERLIPVTIGARLTEVGTLETWCQSKVSENRWRLQFQLRKSADTAAVRARPAAVISDAAQKQALDLAAAVFSPTGKSPIEPEELPSRLEQVLGLGKNSWPLNTIRQMADVFLAAAAGRRKSPAYEIRWLNLGGFCLRPGFGFPGDDFRIEQARRIYAAGLQFGNQVQCEIEWWIFWGRVAGGLNRNQQIDIFQRLSPALLPRAPRKQRINTSLLREMWRTASSLELLPLQTKMELGDTLIRAVKAGSAKQTEVWCLSRLGARQLFYGPVNQVVPPAAATRWVEALLGVPAAGEALASIARLTGDPTRDLAPPVREAVRRKLEALPDAERVLAALEGEEERDARALERIFGEELPSGLVIGEPGG
ncbi:MAG: hsp70 family protein [Bryobacterales bacterium]|nr:hsp70 family protein [Bryobacterales bacterium]